MEESVEYLKFFLQWGGEHPFLFVVVLSAVITIVYLPLQTIIYVVREIVSLGRKLPEEIEDTLLEQDDCQHEQ